MDNKKTFVATKITKNQCRHKHFYTNLPILSEKCFQTTDFASNFASKWGNLFRTRPGLLDGEGLGLEVTAVGTNHQLELARLAVIDEVGVVELE